jgi:hypothetical protein
MTDRPVEAKKEIGAVAKDVDSPFDDLNDRDPLRERS